MGYFYYKIIYTLNCFSSTNIIYFFLIFSQVNLNFVSTVGHKTNNLNIKKKYKYKVHVLFFVTNNQIIKVMLVILIISYRLKTAFYF